MNSRLLPQRATVYTAAATTGEYTVAARTGLACQLAHFPRFPLPASIDRAELDQMRILYWDPAYALPGEHCQVEVRGERWNVMPGTVTEQRDAGDALVYRRCDVKKAVG